MTDHRKQRRFRISYKRALLLSVCVLWAYCEVRPFPSRSQRTLAQTQSLIAHSEADCKSQPFSVNGLRREVFERGHAHMPFGIWGEDRYDFWGYLRLGSGRQFIHLVDDYPLAYLSGPSGTYLLTQMWSRKRWWLHFAWYRVEEGDVREISIDELPLPCAQLRLADLTRNHGFAIWQLSEMLRQSDHRVCEQLERLAQVQPRFAYYTEPTYKGTYGYEWGAFVENALSLLISQCGTIKNGSTRLPTTPDDRSIAAMQLDRLRKLHELASVDELCK